MSKHRRLYRLAGLDGSPHPVLDAPYESIEAAMNAARNWCNRNDLGVMTGNKAIGVEVLTTSGDWRTIRYPPSCLSSDLSL